MDTGWLCIGLFILGVLSFIGHLIWLGIGRLLGVGKQPRIVYPPPEPGDLAQTRAAIDALFYANLIDTATYQRVMEALQIAQARVRNTVYLQPPPLPTAKPIPAIPIASNELAAAAPPIAIRPPSSSPVPPLAPAIVPQQTAAPAAPIPQAPPVPRPPKPPRKSMSDVFAGFMRESNIRWGELVGGMLIVGCSIALVISFWSQIAHHSFLRFGIFTGVTAAMLGLGLYAEHRWKLPTTSRGILLIATLLIPLNFLAFAAISHGAVPTAVESAIQLGALALFGFLVWRAAAVFSSYWPNLLTAGVIGPSASLVLIQRFGIERSTGMTFVLAALPVSIYTAVIATMLARAARWKQLRAHTLEAIFILLGVSTFAAAASAALVVFRAALPWDAAHTLSPLLSIATAPPLAVGLLIWTRVQDPRLTRLRVAGTSIAVAAALLNIGTLALAWPDPKFILPLSVADFALFTAVAFWFAIPAAHFLALPFALAAYLIGFHIWRGNLSWTSTPAHTLGALLDPTGGAALVILFALSSAVAYLLRRIQRVRDAWFYRRVAIAFAIVGLALVSRTAFSPPFNSSPATWVYALYSIVAFAAAVRLGWQSAAWVGCLLLIAASIQFFLTRTTALHPWTIGLLTAASFQAIGALFIRRVRAMRDALGESLKWTATYAAAAAATLLLPVATLTTANIVGAELLWTAALWFTVSLTQTSEAIFVAAEFALAAGAAISVTGRLATHAWFLEANAPLLHPWTLQAIGIVLAIIPLFSSIGRRLTPRSWPLPRWLRSPWSIDRGLLVMLSVGLTIIVCAAEFDAIQIEFATRAPHGMLSLWSAQVAGYGSWLVWAVLLSTVAAWTVTHTESRAPLLLVAIAVLGCPLLSLRFANHATGASSLRWLLSITSLAGGAALWFRRQMPRPIRHALRPRMAPEMRLLLVVMCAVPVIALSVYPTSLTIHGWQFLGPDSKTFFARIGNCASYTIPLALVAFTFLGHAFRERSGGWAGAATAVFNLSATLAYLLAVSTGAYVWNTEHLIRLVQINVIVLAIFALGWIYLRSMIYRANGGKLPPAPITLIVQVSVALIGVGVLLVIPASTLLIAPGYATHLEPIGDPPGCLAASLAFAALILLSRRISAAIITALGASIALMLACAAAHYDPSQWLSFHVLMSGLLPATAATFCVGLWTVARERATVIPIVPSISAPEPDQTPNAVQSAIPLHYQREDPASPVPEALKQRILTPYLNWAGLLSLWLVLLAMRAMLSDPQRPFWSAACTLTLSILWIGMACPIGKPSLLFVGGLLPNLAATFWWIERPIVPGPDSFLNLLTANAAVLAAIGLATIVLHVQVFRSRNNASRSTLPSFHRFALNVITIGSIILAYSSTTHALGFSPATPAAITFIPALLAAGALAIATLADEQGFALVQLYAIGIAAVAIVIAMLRLPPIKVEWAYELGLCAFVAVTGTLYAVRAIIGKLLTAIGLPPSPAQRLPGWLKHSSVVLAIAALCLAFRLDFILSERLLRVIAATAAVLQFAGLLLLATDVADLELPHVTIVLAVVAFVGWIWSWMAPQNHNLAVRACAALLGVTIGITLVASLARAIVRLGAATSLWARAIASAARTLALIWVVPAAMLIAFEVHGFVRIHSVQIDRIWILVGIVIFLFASTVCVLLGLRTAESDPLGIRPPFRGAYIYSAEVLLAVSFVDLRLTMPWLFGGVIAQYWPLVVMAIAFAGVGVGELLARRQLAVVSAPLTTTGVFLPILPVLAFGLARSRVDFAALLFLIGFFYAVISTARRSFAIGMLATLAANGGLWALLYRRPDLRLIVHPQLWLIPAAVSVLIAAQLNRDRIALPRLRFIRYACLMVVYVSSTADIFLNGVHDHPLLPVILAVLSVAGVLLGILFRLRAFLFLGATFLAFAIITMIHYASVNLHWTWLWYVAGIALGTAIIAMFALFEKKRTQMLALVDGLKSWH